MDFKNILVFVIAVIYALTIHEFFHAWTANRLGDSTARLQGRLTLNPIAHIDPVGAICFIIAHFGWGKPVPVNPNNFMHPRRDDVLVSAAGPLSNLASAFIFGLFFQILFKFIGTANFIIDFYNVLIALVEINLLLAIFNFIPLYPLDGSHILKGFLPRHMLEGYEKFCRYSPAVLLGLIFLGNFAHIPVLSYIIVPPMLFLRHIFLSGIST